MSRNSADLPPRLAVESLGVRFGGLTALDDVSFHINAGEIVALIGPNGAGKTTAFNAVCGLVPHQGMVSLDGERMPRRTSALVSRGVSRTLQALGLFESLTARENVAVPLGRRRDAGERAAAQLERLGLAAVADRPVGQQPYPVRKRVALARALVTAPRLLLLDEPAGGLAADEIDELAATVREAAADGCSVLLVEHHVDFVMGLADHIVVLDFGRAIAHGTPAEIRDNPQVEEAYLGVKAAS